MNLFSITRTVSLFVLINLSSVAFSGDIEDVLQLLDVQQSLVESGITWDFEYSEVTLPQLKVNSVEEYAPVLKLRSETAFTIGQKVPSEIFAGFLRELKKNGTELRSEAKDKQKVAVSFDVPAPSGHPEDDGKIEIIFRLDQLAAVEQVAYRVSRLEALVASFSLKHREIAPGVWFPSEITWGNWQNNRAILTTIKNARVVPAFTASDFQVDFPIGTRVADHRQKLNFVASNIPVDEDRAIREYAATYLGDFSALKRRPDNPERSRIRGAVAVLTSLVMIASMYLLWRHRRKPIAMITILTLTSSCAVAGEGSDVDVTSSRFKYQQAG